jgi:putative thioredoxin
MTPALDISEQEFDDAVLVRSRAVPVVVDFWAQWCAPCRALGPTLEREVAALGGRVELKKVDTDRAQSLASKFSVQSIPAVMAFRDGKVVAEFVGARDAGFIRRWLADLAPSEAMQRLEAATSPQELEALLGDIEVGPMAAYQLAERRLAEGGNADEVLALLGRIPPAHTLAEKADSLKRLAAFAADAQSFGGESGARAALTQRPGNVEARFALASALAARGDFEAALESFLEVVTADRRYRDDGARKAMVTIFERLGSAHHLTQQFRRRLQIIL